MIKRFQDIAGEFQDAVVADEQIRALMRGQGTQRTVLAAGILVGRERERRRACGCCASRLVGEGREGRRQSVGLSRSVRAAGGVVWRRGPNGIEVLLIHRPRYHDWSFPKGKVKEKAGEADEEAAVREVEEEVGLTCELGPRSSRAPATGMSKGAQKTVRYWAMALPEGAEPVAGDGVDEWDWARPDEAADRAHMGP